jgi:23S rRNA pseudouridine1911/1915/1917 synthase
MNIEKKYNIEILYEDNHLIVLNKKPTDLVQGDKTGDQPLSKRVELYLKEKYNKKGNVFCGVVHRLDRPVSGALIFAKTSKALERLNKQFRDNEVNKIYWAIVENTPQKSNETLINWLLKNENKNKSFVVKENTKNSKKAILNYKHLISSERYSLLEIELETGRHHQIRCQLANIGLNIKGDLKYGAKRKNLDNSISLHSREIIFTHPTTKQIIKIKAFTNNLSDNLWKIFENKIV